jgi:hypothetical protein
MCVLTMIMGVDYDLDNNNMMTKISATVKIKTLTGLSAEDMGHIMLRSVADPKLCQVKGLLTQIAKLEGEMAQKDKVHDVLQSKYNTLKSSIKVREGSDTELQQSNYSLWLINGVTVWI